MRFGGLRHRPLRGLRRLAFLGRVHRARAVAQTLRDRHPALSRVAASRTRGVAYACLDIAPYDGVRGPFGSDVVEAGLLDELAGSVESNGRNPSPTVTLVDRVAVEHPVVSLHQTYEGIPRVGGQGLDPVFSHGASAQAETERVTRGVAEHPEGRLWLVIGLMIGLGGAELEDRGFAVIEVVDDDVDVHLLRNVLPGPPGRRVGIDRLEREALRAMGMAAPYGQFRTIHFRVIRSRRRCVVARTSLGSTGAQD